MAQLLSPVCTDALKVQNQLQSLISRGRWSMLSKNGNRATWNPMIGSDGKRRKFGRIKVATQDSGSSSAFADDYYAVLGLLPDATPEQIKKAYYNCMKSCHPDLSGNDPETTNFCMFINEVYTVLSDPVQRMVYDEIHGYALTATNPFLDDSYPKDHVFVDEFSCIGRKRVEIDINMVKEVPFNRRTNIRSLSCAIGVAKSTVHRRIQEGHLRPHTNSIKPLLTEENKKTRLRFCLSMITRDINLNVSLFSSMLNCIHIDEKWFSMTKKNQRYYLLPDESPPLRSCKSSTFIDKIMFLCVVARPRFDTFCNTMFKGKIGIFPFVTKEPAKRRSKNRPAGTLETKPINPITKDVIRRMMIDKVVPAIESMWPGGSGGGIIFVQQDNAKPHISVNDPEFVEAAQKNGFDIRLRFQPPNSPDLNVLDLGFFRAIQTLQHEQAPTTIDGLVAAVEKSFEELHHDKLNKIFLTLQLHMIEIMKASGSHNYKQPHFDDNQCPSETIPLQLTCDEELITFVDNQLT